MDSIHFKQKKKNKTWLNHMNLKEQWEKKNLRSLITRKRKKKKDEQPEQNSYGKKCKPTSYI